MDHDTLIRAEAQLRSLPELSPAKREEHISQLRELSTESQGFVEEWLTTETVPEAKYKGMTVQRLVNTMNTHPLIGIIMLDRLMKNDAAYHPIIRERNGELLFNVRDAPRGFIPPKPVAASLTRKIADTLGDFFYARGIDPPELRLEARWPARLGTTAAGVARSMTTGDLEIELNKLRQVIALAGEIPAETDQPLTEIQRIGLALRLIEALAADDLRTLRPAAENS
jgi:hypothetical protein